MKRHAFRFAAAWLLLASTPLQAFGLPDRTQIDGWLARLGGNDDEAQTQHGVDWGLLPGPFYTPETNAGLGMVLVGLYRPDAQDSSAPLSSLSLTGFASVSGAFGFTLDNYSFFAGDRWRLFVNGEGQNLPTEYWGIGYKAGEADRSFGYTAQAIELHPQLLRRVANASWAGLGWELAQMHASRLQHGAANPILDTREGPNVFSSGASLHLLHDTRDFIPNPARGQVWSLDLSEYAPLLGSDTHYRDLRLHYGHYQRLDERDILAFEVHGELSGGEVPWSQLPSLGDTQRMRGYYAGRYRDHDALSTQLEWRHELVWRHGMTLWAGAGTLAPAPDQLGQHWLPSAGAGYRFEFKPRMNVRLDYGIGRDSSGFYFQVGEAF